MPKEIKSSEKGTRKTRAGGNVRVPNDPDELGFYTFFLEGQGNPPDLLGIEDDQLLAIQNDLHERLKARDEARERAISKKL